MLFALKFIFKDTFFFLSRKRLNRKNKSKLHLSLLVFFLPISLYPFGNPNDYNFDGKIVFSQKYKASISSLHNKNPTSDTKLYSSSLSALILSHIENINWTYQKNVAATEFYYGQNGNTLATLKTEKQKPEDLTKNWLKEEKQIPSK